MFNRQINLIGIAPESKLYVHNNWENFVSWEAWQEELQLDIETDVEKYWCTKKLITIQFGQVGERYGTKHQWVLQWSELNDEQKAHIKTIIEGPKQKLIHNAAFEIIILKFYGMHLRNPFCTMLTEKILCGGLENENVSLLDVIFKYLHFTIDKSEQLTFGNNVLTENKVVYAATDVIHLDEIRNIQLPQIDKWKSRTVMDEENEACLAFSDITYHGMTLDRSKWLDNMDIAQPVVDAALIRLNAWLQTPEFKPKAMELGIISEEDTVLINFGSSPQKTKLLQLLFPMIIGATQPIIKKYIRDNGPSLASEDLHILMELTNKNTGPMLDKLLRDHRQYLIDNEFLRPANVPNINWNSRDQVLPIFRLIAPKLQDLAEESLSDIVHDLVDDRKEYIDALKLLSTYGQDFLDKHIEPDGKVRTSFNQIVSTGRVSSKQPNMQNIPAKEGDPVIAAAWVAKHPGKTANDFTTRYRNAFVCEPDEVFVDSDFTGQELGIIAYISKDKTWNDAIKRDEDLHSVCAELVYGEAWKAAQASGCSYYKEESGVMARQKCKCPKHKTMRTAVKTVNFGLAYGMGAKKLAATLKIPLKEAEALIAKYFVVFPAIDKTLKILGEFGVVNGYIQTIAPFFRKRWFPFWQFAKGRIRSHLGGQYDSTLGAIERQSKNHPIQGTGADMMKLAMIKVRRWIYANGYQDQIRIVAQVHDQLTTICKTHLQDMWKDKLDELMCEAARVIIPTGILKADTQITPYWTK